MTCLARIPYNNIYRQVLRMRGDLIADWTEHLDTALAERVINAELDARAERTRSIE